MMARAILVGWLVLLVILVGRWWRQHDGAVRLTPGVGDSASSTRAPIVASAVLVSTPTCSTCPEVRAVLDDVAADADGFTWEEVDGAADLDFVRAHRVLRAPTVLFRDGDGEVVARASGQVSRDQVTTTVAGLAPV